MHIACAGSGSIDFAEFCVLMECRMRNEDTELERREIFCLIDRNGALDSSHKINTRTCIKPPLLTGSCQLMQATGS